MKPAPPVTSTGTSWRSGIGTARGAYTVRTNRPSGPAIGTDPQPGRADQPRPQARTIPATRSSSASVRREQPLRDRPADGARAGVERLEVHRLPHRPRLDVLRLEGAPDRLAVGAERLGVDEQAGQPAVALAVAGLGHEGDPRQVAEPLPVEGEVAPPCGDPLAERRELAASNRREEVRQPVVVPEDLVLVVRRRLARLRGEEAGPRRERRVIGNQRSASRGGDDLVAVERQHRAPPERAGRPAAVRGAERLRGVLDQRHAVLGAGGGEPFVVAALAVEVDRDERPGEPAGARRPAEFLGDQVRVDRPGRRVGVDEDRPRPAVDGGVRAGHEGQVRAPHLVARLDIGEEQGEVKRRGTRRQGRGMTHSARCGELRLEGVDVGAERRDPVRVQRLGEELPLAAPEVRRGEIDPAHGRRPLLIGPGPPSPWRPPRRRRPRRRPRRPWPTRRSARRA